MDHRHQRAQLLIEQNRFDLAENELGVILAENPQDVSALLLISICYKLTKRYQESTDAAQRAISLQPDNARSHLILASSFLVRNLYNRAKNAAFESLRLDPYDGETYALMAQLKYRQKKWEDALQYAEQGLEIDPNEPKYQSFRSLALEKLGRHEVAVATAEESLSRNPDDSFAHATHAWALLGKGDHKKAQESFREALRLDPTSEFAKQGMINAHNANYLVFRLVFRWYSFIGRIPENLQWVIFLGLIIGMASLRALTEREPTLAPFGWLILFVYLVFVITTWIANPLFNTFLRFHRYGKYLLNDRQIIASNAMAGMAGFGLLLGSVLAFLSTETSLFMFIICASYGLFMLIPISAAFSCEPGFPIVIVILVSALLGLIGLLGIAFMYVDPQFAHILANVFVYGNIGAQYLGYYLASDEVQR